MALELKNIMVKNVVTVKSNATVKSAVELMNKHEIGCLVVVRKGKPVGIVTERDMLKRIIHELRDPEETKVVEIMSKPLIAASPEMSTGETAKLMFERRIKKIPVVENGGLAGLVTLTDLICSQDVLDFLNGLASNKTPRRMKKVVDLYFDRARRFRRRCPLMVKGGFSMGCQQKKCMWWLGEECAVTKLSTQMPDVTSWVST